VKVLFGIAAALMLSACATHYQGTKAGAGQQEFANDYLDCLKVSKRLGSGEDPNIIKTCLIGKGWNVQTETKLQLF